MKKVALPELLSEIKRTGIGATQSIYQKSPDNPSEKYQHNPEKVIPAAIMEGRLKIELNAVFAMLNYRIK
jgi:hypothetical protein